MVNRIKAIGNSQPNGRASQERSSDLAVLSDRSESNSAEAPGETVSKVGAIVKKSPTASLLIALAAGLAIGYWVKR